MTTNEIKQEMKKGARGSKIAEEFFEFLPYSST